MTRLYALALCAGFISLIIFTSSGNSFAGDYSASIRASATVVSPLGVADFPEDPDVYLMAPAFSSAFVLFERAGLRFVRTVQADSSGIVFSDFSDFSDSFGGGLFQNAIGRAVDHTIERIGASLINNDATHSIRNNPALLTIIITEN